MPHTTETVTICARVRSLCERVGSTMRVRARWHSAHTCSFPPTHSTSTHVGFSWRDACACVQDDDDDKAKKKAKKEKKPKKKSGHDDDSEDISDADEVLNTGFVVVV